MTAESDVNTLAARVTALKNEVTNSKAALDHYKDLATERDATATTLNTAISGVRNEAEDIKDATNTAYQLSTTAAPVDDLAGRTVSPIHNAVVAAFVYDTTKDSDGGAWRKRTQKTSWYNESGAATGKWLGVHASESDARNAYPNLGSELVTNGTFNTDLTGWTASGSGTASYYYGSAQFQDSVVLTQSSITTGAKTLKLSWDQTIVAGTRTRVRLRNAGGNADVGPFNYYNGSGSFEIVFSTSDGLSLQFITEANHNVFIDNISVKEITSQTTQTGDYFQLSTDKKFYKLNSGSGKTEVFRGSRNEFPAVAVIVAESSKVTIYDGDDPSMPMWMVFEAYVGWYRIITFGDNGGISSVAMLNGTMAVTTDGATNNTSVNGPFVISFVDDTAQKFNAVHGRRPWPQDIAARNSGVVPGYINTSQDGPGVVDVQSIDVAMTVLPDAPIDSATKLPIPTIAVATNGGVSIIKDDGTIVDIVEFYTKTQSVEFYQGGILFNARNSTITSGRYSFYPSIPSSDLNHPISGLIHFSNTTVPAVNTVGSRKEGDAIPLGNNFVIGDSSNTVSSGLSFVAYNPTSLADSMVAYTTSTYASGWMNGDIKLATLADIDSTSLVDIELIKNGGFDDSSNWTAHTGTLSISNGQLTVTDGDRIQQDFDAGETVTNRVYQATSQTGTVSGFYTSSGGKTYKWSADIVAVNAVGKLQILFTNNGKFEFKVLSGGEYVVDNASVIEAVADRSINTNGLEVNGTITREPVAPGAELVAYSGFSSTNYLSQPYNSDLDFGTGDFCVMGWAKQSGTATRYILDTRNNSGGGIVIQAGTAFVVALDSGSNVTGGVASDGVWQFFVGLRESGVLKLYVNGRSAGTVTNTNAASNSSSTLTVGARGGLLSNSFQGSLALLRISATAPTAEQIEYIYDSERVLFNDNAKCTIYGTSDNITALAHDADTGLLHVGTSAGRSVFKGLRRVEATTAAVGSTISAVNGMVVED